MNQTPENIKKFNPGDIITRIEPVVKDERKDFSFIGKPWKFLGIANGCIYIEDIAIENKGSNDDPIEHLFKMLLPHIGPRNLVFDVWENGWSLYVDPYSFMETKQENLDNYKRLELEKLLQKYLDAENYEGADKIRKKLDKLSK